MTSLREIVEKDSDNLLNKIATLNDKNLKWDQSQNTFEKKLKTTLIETQYSWLKGGSQTKEARLDQLRGVYNHQKNKIETQVKEYHQQTRSRPENMMVSNQQFARIIGLYFDKNKPTLSHIRIDEENEVLSFQPEKDLEIKTSVENLDSVFHSLKYFGVSFLETNNRPFINHEYDVPYIAVRK